MIPSKAVAVALLVLLAICSRLEAQVRITTTIDTTVVTVGDRIELGVTVEHPSDAVVVWPDSLDLGAFELLDTRISPLRSQGDRATSSATFSLTAFELGELEIPSFEVTVLHADAHEETLETDRYVVEVVSVGVDDTGDIREIRGPLAIPLGTLRLIGWAALLLLAGGALYALLRRLRAGDEGEDRPFAGPPPRPPYEVALEELARLEASSLLERGQVKEYHIRVSEILRRYVEDRWRVPALEMTTWEVLEGLGSVSVDDRLRTDLKRFLGQCDLVKFAKGRPGEAASRAVLELGREFVERSVPGDGADAGDDSSGSDGRETEADIAGDEVAETPNVAESPSGGGSRSVAGEAGR